MNPNYPKVAEVLCTQHSGGEVKWCNHCRKDNHNDLECGSTRAMNPVSPIVGHDFLSKPIPGSASSLMKSLEREFSGRVTPELVEQIVQHILNAGKSVP